MKNQYKSYSETCEYLYKLEKENPDLVKVRSIGKTWENRDILLATVTFDVQNSGKKPAMLYTGTIHAREWIGNELAIKFLEYIVENKDFDPKLSHTLDRTTLYIVPCLNPDGFEYSRNHFSFWRKNRRVNGDGTIGVDLNRNFSVGFKKNNNTTSNVYCGPEPFSEPETRSIKEFVDEHDNITMALDYHSQGNVFFPAHKFKHEKEIDGTDLNTLCANMSSQIFKVTGRKYGIHRGKPPASLISGSGREYYYSKGIIAVVVEVGTRNIPDYMQNMTESVHENIMALSYAITEIINYSEDAPTRAENFTVKNVTSDSVELMWDYEENEDVYFEIYRNNLTKQACNENNLIAVTKARSYTDIQLESFKDYYYLIRVVNKRTKIKSPFSPETRAKTFLKREEFSKSIFPLKSEIGYVGENTLEQNRKHFGLNSLFVGVNNSKGICYGVISFGLDVLPENAIITDASISIYPINRVGAKIERYGEWTLSVLDEGSVGDITDFEEIHNGKDIHKFGNSIKSELLTQGIWTKWNFSNYECKILQENLKNKKVIFKLEGPTELPIGHDSQMMQFDIGYGRFGGGIHYRPFLDIKYTMPTEKIELSPKRMSAVTKDGVVDDMIFSGIDGNGEKVYGYLNFLLAELPDPEYTVITNAYIWIRNKNSLAKNQDMRFHIEFVDMEDVSFDTVKNREKIEYVGYEVSNAELKQPKDHFFMFDTFSKIKIEDLHSENKNISLVIKPTTSTTSNKKTLYWYEDSKDFTPKLVIEYIKKRKYPLDPVKNFKSIIENGMVKLLWENPTHKDFNGVYVVRNRFRVPQTYYDGVKLFGGKDTYTYDNFGSLDVDKYYSIFTYDGTPNYSEKVSLFYDSKTKTAKLIDPLNEN